MHHILFSSVCSFLSSVLCCDIVRLITFIYIENFYKFEYYICVYILYICIYQSLALFLLLPYKIWLCFVYAFYHQNTHSSLIAFYKPNVTVESGNGKFFCSDRLFCWHFFLFLRIISWVIICVLIILLRASVDG